MRLLLAALILAAAPGSAEEQLPPNHPPLDGSAPRPQRTPVDPTAPLPPGHPSTTPGQPPMSSDELLKQLDATADLKGKEKTFEVASALGKLYYAHARFTEAVEFLKQAQAKAEPTRALFLEQKKKALATKKDLPSAAQAGCPLGPDSTLDGLTRIAESKAKAGDPLAATACARAALHPLMEVESMLANALFIGHDPNGAMAIHERQLQIFEGNPDALFGRAAITLDVNGDNVDALKRAKGDFERFLADYPMHPRANEAKAFSARVDAAIAAGGLSKLTAKSAEERKARLKLAAQTVRQPQLPPQLTQSAIDAVKNTEVTPEMQQQFGQLLDEAEDHLAHARYQDALDNYKRVVPFQPDNGRAKAGMAWSLVGLDKQPMAERVWAVAVGNDPAAVDQLGDALKAKGDLAGAKRLWTKLAISDGSYAKSANLEAKLK